MIRIAICEDNQEDARSVRGMLAEHRPLGPQYEVRHFYQGQYLLSGYGEHACPYDILLLDIEMPGMDGFALAEQLRRRDPDAVIIFLTVHTEQHYLRTGYRYRPFDYLVKPVSAQRLHEVLDQALASLARVRERHLTHRTRTGMLSIPYSEIIRLEVRHNTMWVVTAEFPYQIRKPLRELEPELSQNGFMRVNRSGMVNLAHVRSVDFHARRVRLSNGDQVPMSRAAAKRLSARKEVWPE